jgi:hypothetical protein
MQKIQNLKTESPIVYTGKEFLLSFYFRKYILKGNDFYLVSTVIFIIFCIIFSAYPIAMVIIGRIN